MTPEGKLHPNPPFGFMIGLGSLGKDQRSVFHGFSTSAGVDFMFPCVATVIFTLHEHLHDDPQTTTEEI